MDGFASGGHLVTGQHWRGGTFDPGGGTVPSSESRGPARSRSQARLGPQLTQAEGQNRTQSTPPTPSAEQPTRATRAQVSDVAVAATARILRDLELQDSGAAVHSRVFCAVAGCVCSDSLRSPGWASIATMQNHINAHLSGALASEVPLTWMQEHRNTRCKQCGLCVAASRGILLLAGQRREHNW